jgi:hypothetical protein
MLAKAALAGNAWSEGGRGAHPLPEPTALPRLDWPEGRLAQSPLGIDRSTSVNPAASCQESTIAIARPVGRNAPVGGWMLPAGLSAMASLPSVQGVLGRATALTR